MQEVHKEKEIESSTNDITPTESREGKNENVTTVKTNKKYVLKKIKCEQCEKQFNKKENHIAHTKKVHGVILQGASTSSQASRINTEIPPNSNVTLQQIITRQMERKTKAALGTSNN